jgi:ankyrin repeat protein
MEIMNADELWVAALDQPPLWIAATKYGHDQAEKIRQLVEEGADIDEKAGRWETTALHQAVRFGTKEAVLTLLEIGADVDSKDVNGKASIHMAVSDFRGYQGFEINDFITRDLDSEMFAKVHQLIMYRADISATDNDGETSLHIIPKDLEFIAGAPPDYAEHVEALQTFRLLLENTPDPSAKDKKGNTPLHYTTLWGDTAFMHPLIERGVDVSAKNLEGKTPLHMAAAHIEGEPFVCTGTAWEGHCDAALLLLQNFADISDTDNGGNTTLHIAAEHGYSQMVSVLLEKRADLSATNHAGKTPLDVSVNILGQRETWIDTGTDGFPPGHAKVTGMLRTAEARRAACTALAMGHHTRLGDVSVLMTLPPELMQSIQWHI